MYKNLKLDLTDEKNRWYVKNEWKNSILDNPGIQYRVRFNNSDYGVSIIKTFGSYGYDQDKWEIALTFKDEYDGRIEEDFDLADGVIGNLTDEQVLEWVEKLYNAYVARPNEIKKRRYENRIKHCYEEIEDLKKELEALH